MLAIQRFVQDHVRSLKVVVFLLCLAPLTVVLLGAFGLFGFNLGANPVEALIHRLGNWGLKFLLITLAITPLRQWTGIVTMTRFRRMLGLFAFFYIVLHFLAYSLIDHRLDLGRIIEDIIERPFITIGILALLLLIPLAVTSTRGWQRRLGRRWQSLHRLIYPIAILGVWHFWWQVKQDILEPLIFAGILGLLLGVRAWKRWRTRGRVSGQAVRS